MATMHCPPDPVSSNRWGSRDANLWRPLSSSAAVNKASHAVYGLQLAALVPHLAITSMR